MYLLIRNTVISDIYFFRIQLLNECLVSDDKEKAKEAFFAQVCVVQNASVAIFIHSFIHSFVHSFVRSFIHCLSIEAELARKEEFSRSPIPASLVQ